MASEQQVLNQVQRGFELWKAGVVLPYSSAYASAFKKYEETMKAQAEADKQRAETLVAVASIMSGSLLMAVLGQTSLRAVAGNKLLDVVCRRNLNRTFEAMVVAQNSKTLMFALGKVLDTVKDETKKWINKAATSYISQRGQLNDSQPQVVQNNIEIALLAQVEVAKKALDGIRVSKDMNDG